MTHPVVLHITTGTHIRGGERQALYLHRALRQRGIPSRLSYRKRAAFADRDEAGTFSHRVAGFYDLFHIALLALWCRKHDVSILHCHDSRAFSIGYVLSLCIPVKIIMTRRSVFRIRPSLFNRLKYRRADRIVAISEPVRQHCNALYTRSPVSVIHSGVTVDNDEPDGPACRDRLSLPRDCFVIGSVAFFTREKNVPLLLRLADTLHHHVPHARIACVGRVDKHYRDTLSTHPCIHCTGAIDNAHRYYRAFDLYVSTSVQEGLGTALLDALIRRIPAVALDSGGSRDIFPADSRLHIPTDDADGFITTVCTYIRHPERFSADLEALFPRVASQFSLSRMVNGYSACYARMTAKESK
jgi:glycosyltransferase involved in cell wall biosynthesis